MPTTRAGIAAVIQYVIGCHEGGDYILGEQDAFTLIATIGDAIEGRDRCAGREAIMKNASARPDEPAAIDPIFALIEEHRNALREHDRVFQLEEEPIDRVYETLMCCELALLETRPTTLDGLAAHGESGNAGVEAKVRNGVAELTRRFPIY